MRNMIPVLKDWSSVMSNTTS